VRIDVWTQTAEHMLVLIADNGIFFVDANPFHVDEVDDMEKNIKDFETVPVTEFECLF
jgi:hypothetical protein